MPSRPIRYDVLIAAPGDLSEEIEIARRVMHGISLHVGEDEVTLRPKYFQKDTHPDINMSAQPAIDKQIVDKCEMILAMFWTRRGTKTEDAESGTEHEIKEFQKAGKPGLIYFSNRNVDYGSLTSREMKRMEALKAKFYYGDKDHKPIYVGHFKDLHEFEIKVKDDLERMVREHHLLQSVNVPKASGKTETPNVNIGPYETKGGNDAHTRSDQARRAFEKLLNRNDFYGFKSEFATLALTIVPIVHPPIALDFSTSSNEMTVLRNFQPFALYNIPVNHYAKSVVLRDIGTLPPSSAVELKHLGTLHACYNLLYGSDVFTRLPMGRFIDSSKPYSLQMGEYHSHLVDGVKRFIKGLRAIGIEGPWLLSLSLLKAKNMHPFGGPNPLFARDLGSHCEAAEIVTDSVLVPKDLNTDDYYAVDGALKEPLKEVWRTCRYKTRPLYDADGSWKGWDS